MVLVRSSIMAEAPAEQVFLYLADVSRHHEWDGSEYLKDLRPATDGPVQAGSTFRSARARVTVTEYAAGKGVTVERKRFNSTGGLMDRHRLSMAVGGRGAAARLR